MLTEKKSTKTLILETTERLLAEHGFDGVSLREITTAAGVNVAAVNYHFGSKEKLFEEIQRRYIEPVNEERIRILEQWAEENHDPTVREILDAFMRPFLKFVKRSEMSEKLFFKLMGRCLVDHAGDVPKSMVPGIKQVAVAYTQALRKAVPELSVEQVLWRLHYSFGVMAQTLLHGDLLQKLTDGACGEPDAETQFLEMVIFCEAGFLGMEGDAR